MKQFVLIGHPVGHSLSPQIHRAAYAELNLPCEYSLVDCPSESSVIEQIERLRQREIAGANVTVPWKRLALSLADTADASARDTGAANVWVGGADGKVHAHNTDAPALAAILRAGRKGRPTTRALVIGNGGAALAGVVACKQAGAEEVIVTARKWLTTVAGELWPAAAQFEALGAKVYAWGASASPEEMGVEEELRRRRMFERCQIVVQCTSAGMLGASPGEGVARWVKWSSLPKDACVYDVVYNPANTPFLKAAEAAGLHAEGGLSMLVGQAALAFELWLGCAAPVSVMRRAAARALFGADR